MSIKKTIENIKALSFKTQYSKGVQQYALELLEYFESDELESATRATLIKTLMRGAKSWEQFSRGACSLVTDKEVIERLYDGAQRDSYLRRIANDDYDNTATYWLDRQAVALSWAAEMIDFYFED